MKRCTWCNLNNPKYIEYHDYEWGKLNTDEKYLFEMLILESFQAGLSWQCVLNKREAFKEAYEDFDIDKVIEFDEEKIKQLRNNPNIIRNKLKIKASISNAKIFKSIQEEYQTFYKLLVCLLLPAYHYILVYYQKFANPGPYQQTLFHNLLVQ